jgi:hypothetical protein
MIAKTIAAPTTGEIFFELPLRGESLAGWLNSVFILARQYRLAECCAQLVPQRFVFTIAIGFRGRRLRGAHRIGRRKAAHQPGVELCVGFPVGQQCVTGIVGVLVMRRGIKFLTRQNIAYPTLGHREAPSRKAAYR